MIVIDSGYFVAGIVLHDDVAIRVAPIVNYMNGWSSGRVVDYCKKKNWKYYIVENN